MSLVIGPAASAAATRAALTAGSGFLIVFGKSGSSSCFMSMDNLAAGRASGARRAALAAGEASWIAAARP